MGVIARGQPEVAIRGLPRALDDVLSPAEQLDDGEREVGEPRRIFAAALGEEPLERACVRLGRKPAALGGGQLDEARPALGGRAALDAARASPSPRGISR